MDRAITVTVPVAIRGEAKGVKQQGGLLDFVTREVQVQCLPTDIPEHIDIDVSELMLHQAIRLRDLPKNPKWKPLNRSGHHDRARRRAEGGGGCGIG